MKSIFWLPTFLVVVVAWNTLAQTAITIKQPRELTEAVAALPAHNPKQQQRQRAMQIHLDQATAFAAAGNALRAAEILTDVQQALTQDIAVTKDQQPFFLPFTRDRYITSEFSRGVTTVLEQNFIAPPVPTDAQSPFKDVNTTRNNGDWIFKYLVAAAHPQSPFRDNPELFARSLQLVLAYTESLAIPATGDQVAEFFTLDRNLFAIYCFTQVYPQALLPSQRRTLEIGLKSRFGPIMSDFEKGKFFTWCNSSLAYASGLIHGGKMIGNEQYETAGRSIVKYHVGTQFPDGGFPYVKGQNESEGYHGMICAILNRIWLTTGDTLALNGIKQTANYTPLSIEPPIVGAFWTAPAWKWTWNTWYSTSLESAYHTRSPWLKTYQLVRRAYESAGKPAADFSPYAVMLDLSDIKAKPLPNGYTVFDANIQGPRARYGNFSFAVVGRHVDEPLGLQTFAGCMTIDDFSPKRPLPLNAACSGVFAGPKLKSGDDFRGVATLADRSTNSVMVGRHFASLTAAHSLSGQDFGPRSIPSSWMGNQQWILLPDRIIGMVTVLPGKEPACEVTGRIKLLHGGTGVMYPKEIQQISDTLFSYGTLKVRVVEHNYGTVDIEKNTRTLREGRNTATDVRLRDAQSVENGASELRTYTTPLYFIVEIAPTATTSGAAIERSSSGTLQQLRVRLGDRQFVSLLNVGKTPRTVNPEQLGFSEKTCKSVRDFEYGKENKPSAFGPVQLMQGKGLLIITGDDSAELPPWPSFTAMMRAFDEGDSDMTPFPMPGLSESEPGI